MSTNKHPVICIDTETTGRDASKCGILTIGMVTLSPDLEIVNPFYIKHRIDPEKYLVEQKALEVNGIDLDAHNNDPDTLDTVDAEMAFHQYFVDTRLQYGMRYDSPVRIMGWNVQFDLEFLSRFQDNLYTRPNSLTFPGAKIDVQSDINRLYIEGRSNCAKVKLERVAEHYGVVLSAHNSLEDAVATVKLYKIFREL